MSIENLYKNIFNYDSYTAIAPESEKNMVLRLTNIAQMTFLYYFLEMIILIN